MSFFFSFVGGVVTLDDILAGFSSSSSAGVGGDELREPLFGIMLSKAPRFEVDVDCLLERRLFRKKRSN